MDFVTENAIFLGYEKKTWTDDKGQKKEWLVCRFAAAGSGSVLELNANMVLKEMLEVIKPLQPCRVCVTLKARKNGGFAAVLGAVVGQKK